MFHMTPSWRYGYISNFGDQFILHVYSCLTGPRPVLLICFHSHNLYVTLEIESFVKLENAALNAAFLHTCICSTLALSW